MMLKNCLPEVKNEKNITFYICCFNASCSPTVKVQAPDKPIEINLNVNIEHRIKLEIEKDVKSAISSNPNIF